MSPVCVVPWEDDFLDAVFALLRERPALDLARTVCLFPHRRPGRYLRERFAALAETRGQALLLPRMLNLDEWLSELAMLTGLPPRVPASPLDLASALAETAAELRLFEGDPAFPSSLEAFFPWAARLAGLFDELAETGRKPEDIPFLEQDVDAHAASLLERLSEVMPLFYAKLDAKGLTTLAALGARLALRAPDVTRALGSTHVLALGFHAPQPFLVKLFKELVRAGRMEVLLHTDKAVAVGQGHWCAKADAELVRELGQAPWLWSGGQKVRPQAAGGKVPDDLAPPELADKPGLTLVQGADLHSQLAFVRRSLRALRKDGDDLGGTAVILPEPGLLTPVLHAFKEFTPNVSLGFPLSRSSVASLVNVIGRLQQSFERAGGFLWRDVSTLLRHPYLTALTPTATSSLRLPFHRLEQHVRRGGRFVGEDFFLLSDIAFFDDLPEDDREPCLAAARRALAVCVSSFSRADTLAKTSGALVELCLLLLDETLGKPLFEHFILDAACLSALAGQVARELAQCGFADLPLSKASIFGLVELLLAQTRVPFEGDPLTGLQILGPLEARLLSFRRVFVLEACEDQLPGPASDDPVLPEALRPGLGLRGQRSRDATAAYNFYRLLVGAKDVSLCYQTGARGGIFGTKKSASRFIEQIIWQRELQRGKLLPSSDPLFQSVLPAPRFERVFETGIPKTKAHLDALAARLEKPLSPSLLDAYVACPKKFFHQTLTPLKKAEEVAEDGDPAAVGEALHLTLSSLLAPLANTYVGPNLFSETQVGEALEQALGTPPGPRRPALADTLSPDALIGLRLVARLRLCRYLEQMPPANLLALERNISGPVTVNGRELLVEGRVDRLERREDTLFVLDYKSGRAPKGVDLELAGPELAKACRDYAPSGDAGGLDPGLELLERIEKALGKLQVPLYLHVLRATHAPMDVQGAYVLLAEDGREAPVFDQNAMENGLDAFFDDILPAILDFLLRHMLESPVWAARPAANRCPYCAYQALCVAGRGIRAGW